MTLPSTLGQVDAWYGTLQAWWHNFCPGGVFDFWEKSQSIRPKKNRGRLSNTREAATFFLSFFLSFFCLLSQGHGSDFCCPWHRGVEWRTRQETTDGLTVIIQDDSGWLESVLKHAHEPYFWQNILPTTSDWNLSISSKGKPLIFSSSKSSMINVMLGNMTILTGEQRLATKVPPLSWRFNYHSLPFTARLVVKAWAPLWSCLALWLWRYLGDLKESMFPGCPPGLPSPYPTWGNLRIIDSKVTIGRGYGTVHWRVRSTAWL